MLVIRYTVAVAVLVVAVATAALVLPPSGTRDAAERDDATLVTTLGDRGVLPGESPTGAVADAAPPVESSSPFSLTISPEIVTQGGTLVIEVSAANSRPIASVAGWVGSRRVWFFEHHGRWLGFYSAPAKAIPATYSAAVLVNGTESLKSTVAIEDAEFPVTALVTTPGFSAETVASNIGVADAPALAESSAHPIPEALFSEAFRFPLDGIEDQHTTRNVGAFGNYRTSGGVKLQHLGTDLEADVGTPVYAVNDGVVTLSQQLANYGITVVVDHGVHIFSVYMHLDRATVAEGVRVARGQTIAYSGNSGYSLAPHLHLSMWVNGVSVDPLVFIDVTQAVLR